MLRKGEVYSRELSSLIGKIVGGKKAPEGGSNAFNHAVHFQERERKDRSGGKQGVEGVLRK